MATQPTQVTQYQTGIAPELAPYMQNLLGQQAARMYTYEKDASGKPVMVGPEGQTLKLNEQGQYIDPATGGVISAAAPKISGFQPYEGYERAAGAGLPARSRVAGLTSLQTGAFDAAKNLGYDPTTTLAASGLQNLAQQAGQTSYKPSSFANPYSFTPSSFLGQGTADAYMNPYMQNVVDIQKREAQRASNIAGTQQQAQAVQAGAFGGSRDAIMRAERERNLATQLGDIQATGSNAAYNQAMQQFNAEQAARMQSAGLGAQYGQAAQQLGEQSRQYGAGLGLQGLQTGLSGYGQLAGVGQNLYGQNVGNITLQSQLGTQQQQQAQNVATAQYQDFLAKQNYPQQQMDVMASYIRGTPLSTQSASQYAAPPSTLSQVLGIGTAGVGAYGMYNAMNPQQRPPGSKKGGVIKSKKSAPAGGLEALALSKLG